MARLIAAGGWALACLVALPVALPHAATPVAAHSGLVAVVPAPDGTAVRLVFSEPLEEGFSGADLVTADGGVVESGIGRIDGADAHIMVVATPAELVPGTRDASVAWRALSAADGHVTSGSFPLPTASGALAGGGGAGTPTRGHSPGHLSLEALAKVLAFAGLLVAVGLLPFGRLVVAPVVGGVPRGMVATQAGALIVAAIGGPLLLLVAQLELATAGTVVDPITFITADRIGVLLALRGVVPLAGGIAAAVLIRRGAEGRAAKVAAAFGLATLALAAVSGHAAAFASPVPALVDLVHLAAASVWLGGLIGFAGLIGGATPIPGAQIQAMVPRFSGLAIGSIGLLGLTGLYAAWIETEDWTSLASPYSVVLAVKVLIVGAAFAVGTVNYLDGGRDLSVGGGLARRITIEASLAALAIVAAASLTSADPPALTRTIAIAPAAPNAAIALSLAPGRAGPNLIVVDGPVPVGATLHVTALGPDGGIASGPTPLPSLVLAPLDRQPGAAAAGARARPGPHVGGTISIPPGRWEATVVVAGAAGTVASFDLALDATGVIAGRQAPTIPPPLLAGIGLVLAALFGAVLLARGLAPPLVERRVGRLSLGAFSAIGGVLGVAILVVGPRL